MWSAWACSVGKVRKRVTDEDDDTYFNEDDDEEDTENKVPMDGKSASPHHPPPVPLDQTLLVALVVVRSLFTNPRPCPELFLIPATASEAGGLRRRR
jgi:hypothetical protein